MAPEPLATRFWRRVDRDGPVPQHAPHLGPCWVWNGYVRPDGYGQFWVTGGDRAHYAHRLAWELSHGEPPAAHIDHLCWRKSCVNPAHLESVTPGENTRRSYANPARGRRSGTLWTHCKRGHEFTPENTYVSADGKRHCQACRALVKRERYRAKHGIPLDDPIQPGKPRRTK